MNNEPYLSEINQIISNISDSLIDFNAPREKGRLPTQASSEFITNREQGDWAEDLILRAINDSNLNFCAVKYGKSEKRVTGEEGFEDFFMEYQFELDTIGKRPDILIFDRKNYNADWNYDISNFSLSELTNIVPLAKVGVEIRSSSFLYDTYSATQEREAQGRVDRILAIKNQLLTEYGDILLGKVGWIKIIEDISIETISIVNFRCPSWSSTSRMKEVTDLLKELKKIFPPTKKGII
ncbi:MAG TPA: AccI family restriction endonuclease [Mucilaginibacter sp.]|nr:AccI family restriction endonuclease [Mucilaginibacter sp.]